MSIIHCGLFAGGLAEEVDEKILHAAFIPFGDLMDIQIPLDYETEKHRGFAFVEFEFAEVSLHTIHRSHLEKGDKCHYLSHRVAQQIKGINNVTTRSINPFLEAILSY